MKKSKPVAYAKQYFQTGKITKWAETYLVFIIDF